jgi:N-acetylneuraminic acid mutarotase
MAYDPTSGKVILFGGDDGEDFLDDTWSYDLGTNTWTELKPAGPVPPARRWHSLVYDPLGGRVILFGGEHWDGSSQEYTRLNDTWAYDPAANTWTELKPAGPVPPARHLHSMVYDPARGKVLLFGGADAAADGSMACFADAWAYDPVANTWTELDTAGEAPAARASHSMVYDAGAGKIILYGGSNGTDHFNDTWAFEFPAD